MALPYSPPRLARQLAAHCTAAASRVHVPRGEGEGGICHLWKPRRSSAGPVVADTTEEASARAFCQVPSTANPLANPTPGDWGGGKGKLEYSEYSPYRAVAAVRIPRNIEREVGNN